LLSAIVLLAVLLGSMGCTAASPTPASSPITDILGRTVNVPPQVERVVCVGPGALRLAVYMEAQDRVVGVEGVEKRWSPRGRPYIMAHPELRERPTIGPGGPGRAPDPEAILRVQPHLILATYMDASTADTLQRNTHIPVLVLSYGPIGSFGPPFLKSLDILGRSLHKEDRAKAVRAFIDSVESDLRTRVKDIPPEEKPTVYVGGVGHKGAHGIESTQAHFPPFQLVEARNVADELGGSHHMVSKEQILLWDPDVIFVDEGGLALIIADAKENPHFYRGLRAFREGRVYGLLPFNFYATNVGTALADAYYVGRVLYPQQFQDVDPALQADRIYEFLVGRGVYREMARAFGGFRPLDIPHMQVEEGLPVAP